MLEKSFNCNGSTGATTFVINGNVTSTPSSDLLHCSDSPPDSKGFADEFLSIKTEEAFYKEPENGRSVCNNTFPHKDGSLATADSKYPSSEGRFPTEIGGDSRKTSVTNGSALSNNCKSSKGGGNSDISGLNPMVKVGPCPNNNENMCISGKCAPCGHFLQERDSVSNINGAGLGSQSKTGHTGNMHQSKEKLKDEVSHVPAVPSVLGDGNSSLVKTVPTSNNHDCGGCNGNMPRQLPPPGNMKVNKSTVESQYMQQHSQIFVFSTALANKSTESVLSGQLPSIIAYHCTQLGTRKFLERHPLNTHQFNQQRPAAWLNSLSQMKQANKQPRGMAHLNNYRGCSPEQTTELPYQSHGMMKQPCPRNVTPHSGHYGLHEGCGGSAREGTPGIPWVGPVRPGGTGPNQRGPSRGPHPSNWFPHQISQGTMQGIKVPDEDLTPQQRQHREEQLTTIRKMHQMFFPDQENSDHPKNGSNHSPHILHHNPELSHMHQQQNMICMHPGGEARQILHGAPSGPMDTTYRQQTSAVHTNHNQVHSCSPHFAQQQMDWQNHHMQCYNHPERKGNTPGPTAMTSKQLESSSPTVGASPGPRLQGLPLPYHQEREGCSSDCHSTSPPALQLSSPHLGAAMESRLPHPSPGGAVNSIHSTPLNSPKQENPNSRITVCSPKTQNPTSTPTNMVSTNSVVNTVSTSQSPTGAPENVDKRKLIPELTTTTATNLELTGIHLSSTDKELKALTPKSGIGSAVIGGNHSLPQPMASNESTPATVSAASSVINNNETTNAKLSNIKLEAGSASPATPTLPVPESEQAGMAGEPLPSEKRNMIPVPSPQQIQYSNTFDGQELTIQKQPNASIGKTDLSTKLTGSNMECPGSSIPCPISSYTNPGSIGQTSGPCFKGTALGSVNGSGEPTPGAPGQLSNPDCAGGVSSMSRDPQARYSSPGYDVANRFMSPHTASSSPIDGSIQHHHSVENSGPASKYLRLQSSEFCSPQTEMIRYPRGRNTPDSMHQLRGRSPSEHTPPGSMIHHPTQQDMFYHSHSRGSPSNYIPPQQCSPHHQQYSGPFPLHSTHSHQHHMQMSQMIGPTGAGENEIAPNHPHTGTNRPQPYSQYSGRSTESSPRLTHFDPVVSRNQQENQTNRQQPVRSMAPASNMHAGPSTPPTSAENFHTNMNILQDTHNRNMGSMPTSPPQQQPYNMGPQNVNNMYVNANVSVQHSNIQNALRSMHHQPLSPHHHFPSPSVNMASNSTGAHPTSNMGNYLNHTMGTPRTRPTAESPGGPEMIPQTCTSAYSIANSTLISGRQTGVNFRQPYASPLTNLDNKVPSHNLQYFPKHGANIEYLHSGQMMPMQGMMPNRTTIDTMQGPAPNSMGLQHSGQLFQSGVPVVADSSAYCRPIRPGPSSPLIGFRPMSGSPQTGMMVNRQMVLSPSEISQDLNQSLPPSMGHTLSFKQTTSFYGPTTEDPHYAAQFHNFQQQLYATSSRSGQQNSVETSSASFLGSK